MTVTTTATVAATTPATRDRIDYSLGVDDAERARLLAQCAMHRTEAELLLDRVGLRPGDRALDLGCGPLGVLDLLAERVGPTGRVVGIDREKRYLAIARQELDARGLDGVELVAADATGTDLAPASFDLVHERLVLNNVPQPAAVVDEMVRLTRPGGHVAVQDVDWLTWTCLPEHADWNAAPGEGRGGVERGRAPGQAAARPAPGRRVGRRRDGAAPARVPARRALPPAAGAVHRAAPGPHPRRRVSDRS